MKERFTLQYRIIWNVYNIIESISPIHFWHHYLCSQSTHDNLRAVFVAPAPPRALSRALRRTPLGRLHSLSPSYWEIITFGGYSHGRERTWRESECARVVNARVSPSQWNLWLGTLGLQCWIVIWNSARKFFL